MTENKKLQNSSKVAQNGSMIIRCRTNASRQRDVFDRHNSCVFSMLEKIAAGKIDQRLIFTVAKNDNVENFAE
ncbi:MAG: hypothetical protein D6820_08005 [Lentisphaerae bacterium]|nr:MAG: hypothetical protein D6820_08005 [Lentisphaerota bacterium]